MKFIRSASIVFIFLLQSTLPIFAQSTDLIKWRQLYKDGIRSLADQDLNRAEESFRKLIAFPSEGRKGLQTYQSKAYYFLGDVYFIRKKYSKALVYYRKVVSDYFNQKVYSKTLYKIGRTLVLNGSYAEGVAMLNNYTAHYDNRDGLADNALYWSARGYLGLKDSVLALQTFQLILSKYPDSPLSYDIRQNIGNLEQLTKEEHRKKESIDRVTNQLMKFKRSARRLQKEKILLEKASRLLVLKQQLLQLKNDKLQELSRAKLETEATK